MALEQRRQAFWGSEVRFQAQISNWSRLQTLREIWRRRSRGRSHNAWVETFGTCRLYGQWSSKNTVKVEVLTPATVILAPIFGLKLIGWHTRLAVTMPNAIDKGSSLACPSVLRMVVHVHTGGRMINSWSQRVESSIAFCSEKCLNSSVDFVALKGKYRRSRRSLNGWCSPATL